MLLLHIIIAVSAVGLAGLTLLSPSSRKMKTSYFLTALTFVTGTYLVVVSPAHLVTSCITGLLFLGVVGSLLFAASHRLSKYSSK